MQAEAEDDEEAQAEAEAEYEVEVEAEAEVGPSLKYQNLFFSDDIPDLYKYSYILFVLFWSE